MRILTFLSLILLSQLTVAQPISDFYSLKWSAPIGVTTYRTQMQLDAKGQIWIGSNGQGREVLGDEKDGVYVIKGKTGDVLHQYQPEGAQDGDVNGVALYDKWAFFGSDDRKVYAYKKKKQVWTYEVPVQNGYDQGDIEGQPALADLNGDEFPDVVVAAENYGLLALNGETGELLWEFAGGTGNGHGLNSPAVYDLNGDGIADVLWGTRTDEIYTAPGKEWGNYGDFVYALNGKDGSLLWRYPVESAVHASPLVRTESGNTTVFFAETYSQIYRFDPKGNLMFSTSQGLPTIGISAYFSSPAITENNQLIIGTSWWGDEDDGIWVMDLNQDAYDPESDMRVLEREAKTFHLAGRVSATASMGELYGENPGEEAFIGTESGELFVFSAAGELIHRLALKAGVEAPALVADIDGDGENELVVACLDGMLYCYELK